MSNGNHNKTPVPCLIIRQLFQSAFGKSMMLTDEEILEAEDLAAEYGTTFDAALFVCDGVKCDIINIGAGLGLKR